MNAHTNKNIFSANTRKYTQIKNKYKFYISRKPCRVGTLFCAHADVIFTKPVGTKTVPTLRSNIRFYLRVFAEKNKITKSRTPIDLGKLFSAVHNSYRQNQ